MPWQEDPVLTKLSRRAAVALATGASVGAGQGLAQAGSGFPSRPLRLIIPYAPGGTSDTLARLIAGPMQAALAQSVIVENRPGAGSLLGTEAVVRAPADGYTLLLADTPLTTVPAMQVAAGRPVPYDPTRDLTSILHLASAPVIMFTPASLPVGSVREFFARALASPDTMSIASSGVGSTTHLIAELAIRQSGARIAHIPYRGGGPALQDVAAGNVQATFLAWASGATLVQSGQVRAIGIAAERRMPDLPDIPTLREQGVEIVASFWWGLMGPAGMPAPVQQRLAEAADAALRTSELATRLATLGLQRDIRDAEAFKAQIGQEMQRWSGVISAAGIRAE
ncbi:Bug family tripartite tricarboxylate transporter substrate binding protein [Roseomonas sp. WA12]